MLSAKFNSLRCFSKDVGMVPSAPLTLVQWRFLRLTAFVVHVLDLDNFQFSFAGKFQSGDLQERQGQQFGLLIDFICNNPAWPSILNYMVRLNVQFRQNFQRLIFCTRSSFVLVSFLISQCTTSPIQS